MKVKIKVHVADDHMILIEGIIAMLNTDKDIEVVGYSLTGKQVIEWFKTNEADILVLDINMPELDGIEVLKKFNKKKKHQKIIMLSSYDDAKLVKQLTTFGADGFISKTSAGEHILKAIKSVYNGDPYFSDDIKEGLFNLSLGYNVSEGSRPDFDVINGLTEREMEVLKLLVKEYSTQEMADKLFLSVNTVETYRKNLLKKLNVKNAVGLAMFAVKNKII
ncbi:response regulator transcription factor [Polaribacter uvawellassae]|uniref:response regulator transcription factor n=1 Tax=Polaribacter uvawellassae TaxID=3133495 RepID=UPI00321C193B